MKEIQPLELPSQVNQELVSLCPDAQHLIQNIASGMPKISQDSKAFYKSQSQFMDKFLTISQYTPIRDLRQIIAELTVTLEAISENSFRLKIEKLEIEKLEQNYPTNPIDQEIHELQLQQKKYQLARGEEYLKGALKKASNYIDLYNQMSKNNNIPQLTEESFEEEEERFHIKKVFFQSLSNVRALETIDVGDLEYLHQIGINGTAALADINSYLTYERSMVKQGAAPSYEMELQFLDRMVNKYAGCSHRAAKAKGKPTEINYDAMLRLSNEKK